MHPLLKTIFFRFLLIGIFVNSQVFRYTSSSYEITQQPLSSDSDLLNTDSDNSQYLEEYLRLKREQRDSLSTAKTLSSYKKGSFPQQAMLTR